MNTIHLRRIAAVALIAILQGCSNTTAEPAQQTVASMRAVTSLKPDGMAPPDFSVMSQEEREAYLRVPTEAGDKIRDAVLLNSWADANRKVREVLRSNPDVQAYFLEAVAGTIMLERAVGSGDASEVPAEDLLFYADLLARNITPESDLTARALDASFVKDPATRDEIRVIASRAVESGETFAARPERLQAGPAVAHEAARSGTPPADSERRDTAMRHLRELADG